ncbi:MAG: hypothetical protein J5X21_18560 [Candidatus Accumulibacter sp.]|nr:hypothetical protein [Candidatus Accumulibacter conexus]
MSTATLFSPLDLAGLTLTNRIVMAPMTRSRSTQPGDVPNEIMARYYAQRAGAGLIITEATQVSRQGQGYSFTPGIYGEAQIAGWQLVTDAVHAAGGRIFLQLWHVGRMSHAVFHDGAAPVAPSALAPDAQVWVVGADGVGRMVARITLWPWPPAQSAVAGSQRSAAGSCSCAWPWPRRPRGWRAACRSSCRARWSCALRWRASSTG